MAQADTPSHSKFHEEMESLAQVKTLTYGILMQKEELGRSTRGAALSIQEGTLLFIFSPRVTLSFLQTIY